MTTALEERPAGDSAAPVGYAGPRRRLQRPSSRLVLGVVVTIVVLYLLLGPLVVLVASLFQDTTLALPLSAGATWTMTNITAVFGSAQTWQLLGRTVEYGAGALVLGGALATLFAWLIERTTIPGRRVFYIMIVAGSGIPGLIFAISWSLLLNPTNGAANQVLHAVFGFRFNALSLPGMIFVQGLQLVPLMFLLIGSTFRGLSGSFEDSAATSGANGWQTFRRVTLPLVRPALLGAAIYTFVNIIEWIDVPLVLGLPGHQVVLSTKVYLVVHPSIGLPNYGLASGYGLLLVLLSLLPLVMYNRIIRRSNRYATMTGKGYRPRRLALGRWKWIAFAAMCLYVLVALVLPLAMLFWSSIQPFYGGINREAFRRVSFGAYSDLIHSSTLWSALRDTLEIGVLAALATMILSVVTSWLIVRSRSRFGSVLDFLAFFPHMIPSIVVGLAVLLVYLIFPIGIYGTIWIIVVAMVTKYLALGTRMTTPGVVQIHASLEDAAAASGAPLRQVWLRVLLPMLRPVLSNGFLIVFLSAIQNLTLPLLLTSSGHDMLATLIWNKYNLGFVQSAAALSMLMTVLTIIVAATLRGSTDRKSAGSAG